MIVKNTYIIGLEDSRFEHGCVVKLDIVIIISRLPAIQGRPACETGRAEATGRRQRRSFMSIELQPQKKETNSKPSGSACKRSTRVATMAQMRWFRLSSDARGL